MYPQIIRIKDGRGKLIKDINIQLPKLLEDNNLLTYEGHLYIVISVSIEIQEIKEIAQGQYIAEVKRLK